MPYFALAAGFLTGKYRDGVDRRQRRARAAPPSTSTDRAARSSPPSTRSPRPTTRRSRRSRSRGSRAQPTVTAPIASARTTEQLPDLLASVSLELTADDLEALDGASAAAKAA